MKIKKSILFIVDKPDWAYEFMVKSWLEFLLPEYDCYLVYQEDYFIKKYPGKVSPFYKSIYNLKSNLQKSLHLKSSNYFIKDNYYYKVYQNPVIYKFKDKIGNKELAEIYPKRFDFKFEMAFYFQYTSEIPFKARHNIVGIFTDSFPHEGPTYDIKSDFDRSKLNREDFFKKYLENYEHIIVGGGNLMDDYIKITNKVSFVYGIYGEQNFIENKNVGKNESMVIGWTGSPNRSMKGFREIIEPAIENVRNTGRNISLKTKFSGPYDELYTFYGNIDLIAIASSADSGPSLFAEASLSGVPTISTKVGLPLMVIQHDKNGILINRTIQDLEDAIIDLYDNREKLIQFSRVIKKDYLNKLGNKITIQNFLQILER